MSKTTDYAGKIAKLLAKAESTDSPAEAETLTAAAERLMVQWGISDAMVQDANRKGKKRTEKIVEERITITGGYCRGEVSMYFAVAHGLGTVRAFKSNSHRSTMEVVFYAVGFESDVKRLWTLVESLRVQCTVARKAWWSTYTRKAAMSANQRYLAQRQFIISFGHGVGDRLTATRQAETEAVEPGTAVVLADRSGKVDEHMAANYNLKQGRGISGSLAGSAEGRQAGRNANLGGTQVGGRAAAAVAS